MELVKKEIFSFYSLIIKIAYECIFCIFFGMFVELME